MTGEGGDRDRERSPLSLSPGDNGTAYRQYVEVAVDSLTAPFSPPLHYRLSEDLGDRATVGCRLEVPFRQGRSQGYLLAFLDRPAVADLRDVVAVVDDVPPLPADLLHLGRWLMSWHGCAAGWAFRTVGAPGGRQRTPTRRKVVEGESGVGRTAVSSPPSRLPAACEVVTRPYLLAGDQRLDAYRTELAACLNAGRQAIFLLPEVGRLAPAAAELGSVIEATIGIFPGRPATARRRDDVMAIARGEVDVVIGTRSAVFAPVPDLGLIIVDDEHDESYKQPGVPRYHAREAARERARVTGARVILGSSTPSLEALRLCLETTIPAPVSPRPPVVAVDLREELRAGNRGFLSRELRGQIEHTLNDRGRAVLLINRLGYAGCLLCRRCGAVARCDDCGMAFTLHAGNDGLRCSWCGKRKSLPDACPECGSGQFRRPGGGTERLEGEVRAAFPGARVDRLDSTIAPRRRQQEAITRRFLHGDTDILVGTQLVAGALPGAHLLGVVSVDAALHFPDFRAGERALQFLDGLLRRLGPQGRVVLQSFTPGHYALACLASGDHAGFYRQELTMRRQLGYPPFRRLARVVVAGPTSPPREFAEAIRRFAPADVEVLGPAPALQPFRGGRPRWSILLRGDESAHLAGVLREAWGAWSPRGLDQVTVDIDPLELS